MKDLFGDTPFPTPKPERAFDGATYDHARDHARLKGQLEAVYDFMKDGHWRTLGCIAAYLRAPDSSISARLRDLRKPKYGGHKVERRYQVGGIWEYRVLG